MSSTTFPSRRTRTDLPVTFPPTITSPAFSPNRSAALFCFTSLTVQSFPEVSAVTPMADKESFGEISGPRTLVIPEVMSKEPPVLSTFGVLICLAGPDTRSFTVGGFNAISPRVGSSVEGAVFVICGCGCGAAGCSMTGTGTILAPCVAGEGELNERKPKYPAAAIKSNVAVTVAVLGTHERRTDGLPCAIRARTRTSKSPGGSICFSEPSSRLISLWSWFWLSFFTG